MKDGTAYRYVFCVITEDNDISYDLQLAHTTNIPFDYKIHKAENLDGKGETIENSSASNYTVYTNAKVFQLNNLPPKSCIYKIDPLVYLGGRVFLFPF